MRSLVNHSEVAAVGLNLYRFLEAKKQGIRYDGWTLDPEELDLRAQPHMAYPAAARAADRQEHFQQFLPGYARRVRDLVTVARAHGITPILETQPALYGDVTDDATGVPLGALAVDGMDGAGRWAIMELYNDVTRRVGSVTGTLVIDLAERMPKSSRYFYDWIHFNKLGAVEVARIIFHDLCPFLAQHYAQYARASCSGAASTRVSSPDSPADTRSRQ